MAHTDTTGVTFAGHNDYLVRVVLRVPKSLLLEVDRLSAAKTISNRSELIRQALMAYIDNANGDG